MKKVLLVLAALFVMSALVYAQGGLAGKWTGEQPGRGGATGTPLTLELKMDGGRVTGTMTTGTNAPATIADAKADGSKVTFSVTVNARGNDIQVMYTGEVKGDELTLTRAAGAGGGGGGGGRGGGGGPIVLKRSK